MMPTITKMQLLNTINNKTELLQDGVGIDELIECCVENYEFSSIHQAIHKCLTDGDIYECSPGKVKVLK